MRMFLFGLFYKIFVFPFMYVLLLLPTLPTLHILYGILLLVSWHTEIISLHLRPCLLFSILKYFTYDFYFI